MVTFFAPYACDDCGLEEEKLIDVKRDLDGGKRRTPPASRAPAAAGRSSFDELVEQYFAFLDR